jgi:hypothetical protein
MQFQIHNNQIHNNQIREKKLTLKYIYKEHKKIETIVAEYLKDLTFYRLKKTKEMYKQVLDIDFENIGLTLEIT